MIPAVVVTVQRCRDADPGWGELRLPRADCGGQPYTVAVENGGKTIGAAQVVDAFGHATLVYGISTVIDTTQDIVLGSWVATHGSGHDNQAQTLCVVRITYTASEAFGDALPGGVEASDTILYEIDFWVVLKA